MKNYIFIPIMLALFVALLAPLPASAIDIPSGIDTDVKMGGQGSVLKPF